MHILSLTVVLSYSSAALATQCYNLLGTAPVDDSFQPCDPDASVSACCANNKTEPDICIQGGLCYAQEGTYSGFIYVNGCTDSTGGDASCPHVCPATANGWKYYNVLQCVASTGTWCCREAGDDTNCCNNTEMLVDGTASSFIGHLITTNTTSPSDSDNANTTATATATTTATASSSTTVIGASVGAVLGVSLIIAVASLLWMMNKIKKLKKEVQSVKQDTHFTSGSKPTNPAQMGQSPYEMPLMGVPADDASEADWNNQRYEMGTK